MAEAVSTAEMRSWFDGLSDVERDGWLDAWEDGVHVPTSLIDTLPPERRPGAAGASVTVTSTWWINGGDPAANFWMTDELRDFLGEERRRRRG